MRVLITRPQLEAERTQAALAVHKIDSILAPVIKIVTIDGPPPRLDDVQAIAVTSRNGVRALAARISRRDIPVFAVGDATRDAALAAGFAPVQSADGDAKDLAALITAQLRPSSGALLHATGEDSADDLVDHLTRRGFAAARAVLYRAQIVAALPPAAVAALGDSSLDGVLLFSPRSASAFVTLTQAAGLAGTCGALTAFCLSPAVADALATPVPGSGARLAWRRVAIAARPTQAALIDAVTRTME